MTLFDKTPSYNLNVVVHETGLKPDTLRIWEKRYGLPQPQRTSGGHRLYSQYDIEMLKWFVARKAEGLAIKRVVDLWRKIEAKGQDPLVSSSAGGGNIPSGQTVVFTGKAIAEAREAWISACKAFDEQAAENKLAEAFALYAPEVVCIEVLQKGLVEIGQGWYQGQISIQQEHFATALAMRRLQALVASVPPATRSGLILVGCPPEEDHSFSALLLTLLLRRHGWSVTYLGANVPLLKMEEMLAAVNPHLVVMAAQHLYTAATLSHIGYFLREYGIALAFGGGIFTRTPTLHSRIPGHFLGDDLTKATQVIEKIITSSPQVHAVEPVPSVYQQALIHFQAQQASIETYLWQAMPGLDLPSSQLSTANRELAKTIIAALTLGDINLADASVVWVEHLLQNHHLPPELLHRYLAVYYQAGQTYLDDRGTPIITWLAKFID